MTDEPTVAVKVIVFGSAVHTVRCPPGRSVPELLDELRVPTTGKEIRINGQPVGASSTIAEGDWITVIPQIRGGAASIGE